MYKTAVKLEQKYVSLETAVKHCNGNAELINLVKLIRARSIKRAQPLVTVKAFCDKLICARLMKIAKTLPDEGYSMGSKIRVTFCKFKATDDRTQEYAKSSKYRAKHGFVGINMTLNTLINTQVIGGVVTYIYPGQRTKVKRCSWYEGKGRRQSFELIDRQGYIYAGFHATTKEAALRGGTDNLKVAKQRETNAKRYNKALRLQYSFADSLNAGNCEAGTRAFCIRLRLNESKKYRGSFLMKEAKEKSTNSVSYIERMIYHKMK